jgi:hypothetical protein
MTQFQPSDISNQIDLGTWYDDAKAWLTGTDASAAQSSGSSGTMTADERAFMSDDSVEVNDGGGSTWQVFADGSTKMIATSVDSYKSMVGVKKSPAASKGIIANLRAGPTGNAAKIDAVTGQLQLPAPRFKSSGGGAGQKGTVTSAGTVAAEGDKITDQVWFWPVVVLGSTTVLAGGAYAYLRYTKHGQQQYTKLVTAAANPVIELAKKNSGTAVVIGATALVGVLGVGGYLWWKSRDSAGGKHGKRKKGSSFTRAEGSSSEKDQAKADILGWAANAYGQGTALSIVGIEPYEEKPGAWFATLKLTIEGDSETVGVLWDNGTVTKMG